MVQSSPSTKSAAADADALAGHWERLAAHPNDTGAIEALLDAHRPLIRSELSRARARLPRHIDIEELETAGLEGLYWAISHYDRNLCSEFARYARRRIRGAMIDYVRSADGVPRSARRAVRTLSKARQAFLQRHGREPSGEELAAEVGIPVEKLNALERRALSSNKLSLDAPALSRSGDGPAEASFLGFSGLCTGDSEASLSNLTLDEMKAKLVRGLKALPDRDRSILVLYYHEGIMFTDIAEAMGVSESRVSQIHSRALARLKAFLSSSQNDVPAEAEAAVT